MTDDVLKAEFTGEITIGDVTLDCAVLPDGTRLLSERAVVRAFGGKRGGSHWRRIKQNEGGANLPVYLSANNIKPFIPNELAMALTSPIQYRTDKGGAVANGLDAKLLPEVCNVWLEVRDAGKLHPSQIHLALQADMIMRALATIGIVALVDEATGYQGKRDNDALQKILDKYLQDYARKWAKTFPDEFWHKLIKIKGYPSYMAIKRPSFVGHWVNDVVYSRLAPGIAQKLKELNPRDDKGNRKNKHHQHLSEDHGLSELREHLSKVMVLMDAAANSREFERLLNRSLPKYGDTIDLPFEDM